MFDFVDGVRSYLLSGEWSDAVRTLSTMVAVFSVFFAIYKFWVQQRLRRQYAGKLEQLLQFEERASHMDLRGERPPSEPEVAKRKRKRMSGNDLAALVDERMNNHFANLIALVNANDRRNARVNFVLSLVFYVLGVATPVGLKHFFDIG